MSGLIGLLNKNGEDATHAAVTMLKALKLRNIEKYGIASFSTVTIEHSPEKLQNINSPQVIGHVVSKIMKMDRPQPLKLREASVVFDGRIFSASNEQTDAEAFASWLNGNRVDNSKSFMNSIDSEFAFVIAEEQRLIAGRDLLGAHPLYYGENPAFSGLASERKALWRIGIEKVASFDPGCIATLTKTGFKFTTARKLSFPTVEKATMKSAAERLQVLLDQAVKERLSGVREVAVAFSGGLDSSVVAFLAKKSGVDVQLIHVSLKDQLETVHAKKMADELKLPLHLVTYADNDVAKILPIVLYLVEDPDPVKVGVGIPFYWTAEKAAEMKLKVMLTGQGADELFAGYRRYVDKYILSGKKKVQEVILKDIREMYKDNSERDFKICNYHGVEERSPFAIPEIVEFAGGLPIELKLDRCDNTLRKLVLRQVARQIGLPKAIVDRPKRAVQYATGVGGSLGRAAHQRHMSLKEYLEKEFQAVIRETMRDG